MEYEKQPENIVSIDLTKSSSKEGNRGYSISIKNSGNITKEHLEKMMSESLEIALKAEILLNQRRS